ncbi:tetratricopeptide repeat protein [Streptomyces sioyaensis]|uniref:tetratricopeptide repeat protein n=1 Tax=Streptomyces sioyaensis TaxID=67364 RepID=UPI0037B8B37B
MNGKSVPSGKHGRSLKSLVGAMEKLAQRKGNTYPRYAAHQWEEMRLAAWRHRQAGRTGQGRVVCRVLGEMPPEADCYQERLELRERLEAAAAGGTAVLGQVVTGMGGVGKTQLAARYARTAGDMGLVDVLLWVTAASHAAVTDAYAGAAAQLLGTSREDPQAASVFLNWLRLAPGAKDGGARPGARWLVVLDDVPHTAAARGLWPPNVPHGQTLVTTRNRHASFLGSGRRRIEIDRFTTEEAVAYLAAKLAGLGRRDDPAQIAGLAEDLGRLPLALSQAVPFMDSRHLDCAAYRKRLANRVKTLTGVLPTDTGLSDDQNKTVAAAWDLSIELADQQPPQGLARPMLHVLSLLDPNGIPAPALTSPPILAHLAAHRARASETTTHANPLSDDVDDIDDATDALRNLHQFSLIDHDPSTPDRAVRIHQLVQRAVHERLPGDERHHTARTAADALTAAWPEIERDTGLAAAFRANTAVLTRYAEDALYRPATHPVLDRTGTSLGRAGQVAAARDYYQHLTEQTSIHLGKDHPDTLMARHELARWRGEAGDVAGAANAFAEVLEDRVRVLGDDHPDTLAARGNFTYYARGMAGDAAGAAAAFAELLEHQQRVVGNDHPDTLKLRNNLARFRGETGDAAGAAEMFAELLEDQQRVLGDDDPDTLMTRNNLAYARGMAGDVTGAANAFAELLEDRVRVLGDDHPDTLVARHNLAALRGMAGDAAGAAAAFAELLEDQQRVVGNDHPATLRVRSNLARWRGEAGDAAGAADAFAELLDDYLRVLGDGHPDTLTAWNYLALWRHKSGDAAGAANAYVDLMTAQERVLGDDHPATLKTRHELARWRRETGDDGPGAG